MESGENHIQDAYRSISGPSEGLYKELGSRFISKAFPVASEDEAASVLNSLRKEYHDARHCCFAWRLGPGGERWRSSDDGEPSSTAGRPIMGQIVSAGLSDILVAVVRYFGGIKLGVPGLIRAYRTAAADAISKATVVEKTACRGFIMNFGYDAMPQVQSLLKDMGLPQEDRDFGLDCRLRTSVRLSAVGDFLERAGKIGGCMIEETG